jgi:EAL domain-containing protein (putative c-di-GMP-specific phosphodiesterase class I)
MIRVALIDDHEMILQSVVRLLRDEPEIVVVGSALNATSGIEMAKQAQPDVIIIDYSLPDMDAPNAIRILRMVCPETKVITFSGSEKPGAFYQSLLAGSSAWVTKTRAIQDLRDAVVRVASGERVRSEVWDALPELSDLVLHFQPVVDLTNGRTAGFEALVRWQHPIHGLLPPDQFLPFAEETGFIVEIDRWVWEQAALQLKKWHLEFSALPLLYMSLNLSARDLSNPDLVENITKMMSRHDINPAYFVFEVTETVFLDDSDRTMDFLSRLKGLGAKLALDDFGTAFSSLSYLRRFPFDILKVDISFTSEIPHSERSTHLVDGICYLARSMEMTVVAEGIERVDQVDALTGMMCDYGQGYLFSHPFPAEECSSFLAST